MKFPHLKFSALAALIALAAPLQASRSFTAASNHSIESTVTAFDVPFSVSVWINPTSLINIMTAFAANGSGTGTGKLRHYMTVTDVGGGDMRMRIVSQAGGDPIAISSNNVVTGSWQHVAGVWASSTSRSIYLQNVKVTNSVSASVASSGYIDIGNLLPVDLARPWDGAIAEVAVWSVALTDTEVASLSKGISPRKIRPQSLVFYSPLTRNVQDIRGAAILTDTGTTAADHPRIYR